MKTIVVTNRKGGVGKTTVATHLAAGLALHGHSVALVDTDPQGHVMKAFGQPKEDGLYQIMVDEDVSFADVLRAAPPERFTPPGWAQDKQLIVLPGAKASALIPGKQQSPFRFRRVLRDMGELLNLDFIIVDTGPSSNMFDGSVNLAADYFLYVTECASLSFDGLKEAMQEMEQINKDSAEFRAEPAKIMGIIPNMARFNTSNHRENIAMLADAFPGLVWKPITERTVWEKAMDLGQMVYSYMPNGQEWRDAWSVVEQVEQRVVNYVQA